MGESVRYAVGAHETFVFRSTWLKKGMDAVRADPAVFSRDIAPVILGVGKNMVRSIRFWCLATQLVEEQQSPDGRKILKPTAAGIRLLGDDGWDPYLDDMGSLWLLHWLLATNAQRASAWYHLFSGYPSPQFTRKHLFSFLQHIVERHGQQVASSSLERDVDCFIRTYLANRQPHVLPEVALECPLTELHLIWVTEDSGWFQFHIGAKDTLPVEVFGYALMSYASSSLRTRRQMSISECLYGPGSPGQVFRLDEVALVDLIEKLLPRVDRMLELAEVAGVTHLFFRTEDLSELCMVAQSLLNNYYHDARES